MRLRLSDASRQRILAIDNGQAAVTRQVVANLAAESSLGLPEQLVEFLDGRL
jgi:hypothetical protein